MSLRGDASLRPAPLRRALSSCRLAFLLVGVVTAVLNVLMLTGSLFMLEVYDRVIPSSSVPTLIGLCVLAASLFAFQGLLDLLRGRVLTRVGWKLDEALSSDVFTALVRRPLRVNVSSDGLQPLRDFDQIKAFLSSPGPTALFDLPWIFLYLGICFLFHVWLGVVATVGGVLLIALTLLTETTTRARIRVVSRLAGQRLALAEASRSNAEVLHAMGMGKHLARRWSRINDEHLAETRKVTDIAGGLGAVSRVLRMVLQSAVLAMGAWLVIHQQASAGVIIAASILTSRALAPVELAIAHWRGFLEARQSWTRLNATLSELSSFATPLDLPLPNGTFAVEAVVAAPPGQRRIVVADISFRLKAGQGLGIVGPSASGKSSLARLLVGVWKPVQGLVRLDEAAFDNIPADILGRAIGYLPQDVELFDGTVAENIARFDPDATDEAIVAAAKAAGAYEMIQRLPDGFNTPVGESGRALSAGQQQRIALARALYGDPFLVVLDEPNANLDPEGDEALTAAVLGIRSRGGIAIVIAHRPSALAGVDLLLVMNGGRMQAFGPKDEVTARVRQLAAARQTSPTPLNTSGQVSR